MAMLLFGPIPEIVSIDGCTSRQVAVRSEPIQTITSSGLLDDILPTLFIPAMFKPSNAVQIRVSIDEIELDVWRRLVLPVHWNLEHLHLGIQAAFNWWNYHLYEFRSGGLRYGDVETLTEDAADDDPRVFDQTEVRLLDFEQGSVFSYHYDFGDGWRHTVVVEEFLNLASTPKNGSCIAGERARPPEDVGVCQVMSGSWRSSPIGKIQNMPRPFVGAVATLTRNGSTWRWWTRMCATLCAQTSNGVCINRNRKSYLRNELSEGSRSNKLKGSEAKPNSLTDPPCLKRPSTGHERRPILGPLSD